MTNFRTLFTSWYALGLVALTILLVSVFSSNGEETIERPAKEVAGTYVIHTGNNGHTIHVSGNLDSENIAVVSSEAAGAVTNVYKSVGDQVFAGEIIASIDHSELSATLKRLEASLAQAEAGLAAAITSRDTGIAQAEIGQKLAEVTEDTQTIAQAQQTTDLTRVALSGGYSAVMNLVSTIGVLAELENAYRWDIEKSHDSAISYAFTDATLLLLGRDDTAWWEPQYLIGLHGGVRGAYEELLAGEYTATEVVALLDDTYEAVVAVQMAQDAFKPVFYQVTSPDSSERISFGAAQEMVQGALVSIPEIKRQLLGVDIARDATEQMTELGTAQANEQLSAANSGLNSQVAIAEAGVAMAQAQIGEIQAQIANAYIRAPFAGVISEKYITQGTFVGLGQPVVRVVAQKGWKITTSVSEVYNEALRVGGEVQVTIDGVSGEYSGTIASIAPSVDSVSRKIAIEVSIDGLPDSAKAGLLGRVTIPIEFGDAVLIIPSEFLRYDYRGAYVISEGGQRHEVVVDANTERGALISSESLTEGVAVIRD